MSNPHSINVDRVKVGVLQTNTWIIQGPENDAGVRGLIVVDPGAEPERILDAIADRPVAAVLLTHGHFDHIYAADEVADDCQSFLHLAQDEVEILPELCRDVEERYGIKYDQPRIDFTFKDGETKELGGMLIRFMVTPGHTPGSAGFLIEDPPTGQQHYFSGDTLFARDVGRTDMIGGDQVNMERSIERLAKELDPKTIVYPGHGPTTTIEREAGVNSYWPT
jgi:glyoxylase-like metal-dependent hydrolase (beta-lactamase superfamily II)